MTDEVPWSGLKRGEGISPRQAITNGAYSTNRSPVSSEQPLYGALLRRMTHSQDPNETLTGRRERVSASRSVLQKSLLWSAKTPDCRFIPRAPFPTALEPWLSLLLCFLVCTLLQLRCRLFLHLRCRLLSCLALPSSLQLFHVCEPSVGNITAGRHKAGNRHT